MYNINMSTYSEDERQLIWAAGVSDHASPKANLTKGAYPHITLTFRSLVVAQAFEDALAPIVPGRLYAYKQIQYKVNGFANCRAYMDLLLPYSVDQYNLIHTTESPQHRSLPTDADTYTDYIPTTHHEKTPEESQQDLQDLQELSDFVNKVNNNNKSD